MAKSKADQPQVSVIVVGGMGGAGMPGATRLPSPGPIIITASEADTTPATVPADFPILDLLGDDFTPPQIETGSDEPVDSTEQSPAEDLPMFNFDY